MLQSLPVYVTEVTRVTKLLGTMSSLCTTKRFHLLTVTTMINNSAINQMSQLLATVKDNDLLIISTKQTYLIHTIWEKFRFYSLIISLIWK